MSLRAKIAIGVLAATALLAAALTWLGLEAKRELDRAAQFQRQRTEERYHENAVRSVEALVLAWLGDLSEISPLDVGERLADPDNGILEAALVTLEAGEQRVQHIKPAGGGATLSEGEEQVIAEVFASWRHRFVGAILYAPFQEADGQRPPTIVRLKLDVPPIPAPALPEPVGADLWPLTVAAFTTLVLAMLAVFGMLMFALRRFVLAPLGDVLQDSRLIVKGAGGLAVRGGAGGKGGDIETLVAAFNAMFSELKDYQSDLEGKVKDATRTIRQQQQSLVIAQRLAATGTLAAGLAHEVNNPLSGMLNAARRLRQREGLDERARDYIGLIEEGLGRIESLMKQILDFSRRRDMKPERFAAEDALRRSLPLVRHRLEKHKIKLEENVAADAPPVFGNEEEIGQVLMNLLLNAIDAAPEGGAMRVSIGRGPDGGAVYTIEDSGPGVPEEIAGRIFDPFFTTKEPGKGTGLGLAIVHTVVGNHGGRLRMERSTRLGGARFVVELPPAEKRETRRIEAA